MRRRYKILLKNLLIVLIAFAVLLEVVIVIFDRETGMVVVDTEDKKTKIPNNPISLDGYTQVELSMVPGKIVLARDCVGIVFSTTVEKSHSIQRGKDVLDLRPNEHDLMRDIIDGLEINPKAVSIDYFNNEIYYASIILENKEKILRLDSKPSDALALSTRLNIPIYISNEVLNNNGQKVC